MDEEEPLLARVIRPYCQGNFYALNPCPFIQVLVGSLALKIQPVAPLDGAGAVAGVLPSATSWYAKIRLEKFPHQNVAVSLFSPEDRTAADPFSVAARFRLSEAHLERIAAKPSIFACSTSDTKLKVSIYTGQVESTYGVCTGRLLGKATLPLDLKGLAKDGGASRAVEFHSGWVSLAKKARAGKCSPSSSSSTSSMEMQLYLTVKAVPDPRFVFEYDAEPKSNPQVFQVQGNMRQPVFTCNFSCRNPADRNFECRSTHTQSASSRSWFSSFGSDRERQAKERKGWSVTVHDLSGSPVAVASMVTPFVASPGTDRVSRSNPGAWLVLRPGDGTWQPWGRLEAWRHRGVSGASDSLGYRFELLPDAAMGGGINLAENTISTVKGGKFVIDLSASAASSPKGNDDLSNARLWPNSRNRGFVMSATVGGEGRGWSPKVEVGLQHVACAEDAAGFVALASAVDLSMEACRLFSHRLRKERSAPDLLR